MSNKRKLSEAAEATNTTIVTGTATVAREPLCNLEQAVLTLKTADDVARFLSDLCTPAEITAFRERWALAQMIDRGDTYRDAAERTSASTATVTRVARFLQQERHHGYRLVLDRLHGKKAG